MIFTFFLFWFLLVCVVLGVFFVGLLVFLSRFPQIDTVVCKVVCEVAGPSELSWRAQPREKKTITTKNEADHLDPDCNPARWKVAGKGIDEVRGESALGILAHLAVSCFTKTRVCSSCFGSTNSGTRLFTKTQICLSCFGSTNLGHPASF